MILETNRLIIRKPEPQDFGLFWSMLTDPVAKKYTGGVTTLSYEERKALFDRECAEEFSVQGAEFAVVERDGYSYLGYCGFRYSEELGGNEFLFGYCREAWGRGIATEAAKCVLAYLFNEYPHNSYIATVVPENIASKRVLKKVGFVRDGSIKIDEGQAVEKYLGEAKAFYKAVSLFV